MNTTNTYYDENSQIEKVCLSPQQKFIREEDSVFLEALKPENQFDEELTYLELQKEDDNIVALRSDFLKVIVKRSQFYKVTHDLSRLRNPFIAMIHSVKEEEHGLLIEEEYVDQASYFSDKIGKQSIVDEIELKCYLDDIIQGLEYLHEQDLIHLNISINSIFARSHQPVRSVKIAKLQFVQRANTPLLRVSYQSLAKQLLVPPPELSQSMIASESFEMFCLGVFLFQIATGKLPSRNNSKNLKLLMKYELEDMNEIILAMLEPEPSKRITLQEVKERLHQLN